MSYELEREFYMFVIDFADISEYPTKEEFWKLVEQARYLRNKEFEEAGI